MVFLMYHLWRREGVHRTIHVRRREEWFRVKGVRPRRPGRPGYYEFLCPTTTIYARIYLITSLCGGQTIGTWTSTHPTAFIYNVSMMHIWFVKNVKWWSMRITLLHHGNTHSIANVSIAFTGLDIYYVNDLPDVAWIIRLVTQANEYHLRCLSPGPIKASPFS